MLMTDIKISGWHNLNGSWKCAFRDFSNDKLCNVLPEFLVECDLYGYSTLVLDNPWLSYILDIPFDSLHMNIKGPRNNDCLQDPDFSRDTQEPTVSEDYPAAQVLKVLDTCSSRMYMYLSMTNIEFWNGATEQLFNEFGRWNIGGFMIAAGHCKAVDDKLKGALQP